MAQRPSELRASAEILLKLDAEHADNEKAIADLKSRQESLRRQRDAVKAKLLERVGGNDRDRRIVIGDKLVHVEFEKGVSVHTVEV